MYEAYYDVERQFLQLDIWDEMEEVEDGFVPPNHVFHDVKVYE